MDDTIYELILDEDNTQQLLEHEAIELKELQKSFIQSYYDNMSSNSIEKWLEETLKSHLPERGNEEIQDISKEIIETITLNDLNKKSLEMAVENGRSKESWFATNIQKATSYLGMENTVNYLNKLDAALNIANTEMYNTIITKKGNVNMNPNLDGFIAEQHHVNSFNLEAKLKGSEYSAKVLKPEGNGYAKNSVDIVIVDKNGKIVKKYQSKYCKETKKTENSFKKGDYRGQQKLTPEDQTIKKSTTTIESPDGIKSKPISKKKVKEFQNEAQSGSWNELNWNEYKTKDLAIGIGKKAGLAGLQGAAISTGFYMAEKLWKKEEIKRNEVIETAIKSGADVGLKAACAGALKVAAEKELIKVIPKGTPAGTIANIAYMAVENIKVIGKVATNELSVEEGLNKMEETTVAIACGIVASEKGVEIGASIGGLAFGPVGFVVGGFIGGSVGYMVGSKFGESIVKTEQKIRKKANEVVKAVASNVVNTFNNITASVKNGFTNVLNW